MIVLAIIAIVALLIAGPLSASGWVLDVVAVVPDIALPGAIILLVILLVLGARRRMRANPKGAGK